MFFFSKAENSVLKGEGNGRMLVGVNSNVLVFRACRLMFFKYIEFYLWMVGAKKLGE